MISESDYRKKIRKDYTQKNDSNRISQILNTEISLFPSKFKDKHKVTLYGEMSVLMNAGVDVIEALEIVTEQFKEKRKQKTLKRIKESLIEGDSLSVAMRNSQQFSEYELFSVNIGEETSQLVKIFTELNSFFQRRIIQRRKIISALSYPIIVSITAVFAIAFMLRFLVPMFSSVYKQFGGDLPQITRFVLSMSNFLQKNTVALLLFFIVVWLLYSFLKKKRGVQKLIDTFLFNIPLFGNILKKIYLARFARAMALLLGAGIPLLTSLDFTKKMVGRVTLLDILEKTKEDIIQGGSLHESLSNFSFFSSKFIAMIKVGEMTNQLPYLFHQLSEQYTNEIEHQTNLINSILEPILILFLGFVVGFILIALYLPIFELSTNFGV